MAEINSPQLLTTGEVAQILRLSSSRIQELVAEGALHPIRVTAKGNFRFRRDEIDALIAPRDVEKSPKSEAVNSP
jgi:excisionase family DNA binding protein